MIFKARARSLPAASRRPKFGRLAVAGASVVLVAGAALAADPTPTPLPDSLSEALDGATVVIRHELDYWPERKLVDLKKLDVDLDDRVGLRARKATHKIDSEAKAVEFDVVFPGDAERIASARVRARSGVGWSAEIDADLPARDFVVRRPELTLDGFSLDSAISLDGSLEGLLEEVPGGTSPAAPRASRVRVRELAAKRVRSGALELRNLRVEGSWDLPRWRIARASVDAFDGSIRVTGSGILEAFLERSSDAPEGPRPEASGGTFGGPTISVRVEAEDVDLPELLRAFQVESARDFEGLLTGTLAFESEGRAIRRIDVDARAERFEFSRSAFEPILRQIVSSIGSGGSRFVPSDAEMDGLLDQVETRNGWVAIGVSRIHGRFLDESTPRTSSPRSDGSESEERRFELTIPIPVVKDRVSITKRRTLGFSGNETFTLVIGEQSVWGFWDDFWPFARPR